MPTVPFGTGFPAAVTPLDGTEKISFVQGGVMVDATTQDIADLAGGGGGSGTVTSVNVSGGTTGLTTSGGPVTTSGTITLAGTLVAANGGTGQTSYTIGDILYASGAGALSKLAAGTATHVLTSNGAGVAPSWQAAPGGGGSPGGSDTQVQFNDGGAFGGDAGLVYNKTTDTLTTVNLLSTTNTLTGLLLTAASASGSAGFRLPHGAAPSSPTNGDVWTTTTGMFARINGATVGPFSAGGGSLTNWTEGVNTSAPNNGSTSAVYFDAVAAATNADAVIRAKATGATLSHIPDNTATGGNKRGAYATDFQKQRSGAAQVASGQGAFIGSGLNNTASATASAVVSGQNNTASNSYAAVVAGSGNAATGAASVVSGGSNNLSSGADSCCPGGANNDADGQYSFAMGFKAQARGIIGAWARSSGGFNNVDGDGQTRAFTLYATTTNATQTTATADRGAAGTANQIVLPNNSAFVIKGTINVRENATGDSSAWEFTAYIKRGANAAATAMVAACTPVLIAQDAGAASWVVAVDADTTNGALRCRVTGEAAHSLKWGWDIYSCNEVST